MGDDITAVRVREAWFRPQLLAPISGIHGFIRVEESRGYPLPLPGEPHGGDRAGNVGPRAREGRAPLSGYNSPVRAPRRS